MAGDAGADYIVDYLPPVNEQIRASARRAAQLGLRKEYVEALKTALAELARDPFAWGDPLYHTVHEGGLVCHRSYGPITVHCIAYEVEKTVMIRAVKPLASPEEPSAPSE
jgi:hypothetical protein